MRDNRYIDYSEKVLYLFHLFPNLLSEEEMKAEIKKRGMKRSTPLGPQELAKGITVDYGDQWETKIIISPEGHAQLLKEASGRQP